MHCNRPIQHNGEYTDVILSSHHHIEFTENQGVKLTDGEIQQLKEHEELEKQEVSKRFEHKLAEAKVRLNTLYMRIVHFQ